MNWWAQFDAEEVRRDFARLRDAGFDSVRVFLRWNDFQPTPDAVADSALGDLRTVADIAGEHDLSLVPTLFTGHMSGVNWFPEWATEPSELASRFRIICVGAPSASVPKNWFSDGGVLEAQSLLARKVAATLGEHPALWAYDLGNENSNCVVPPNRESGVNWLVRMTHEIRAIDPAHPITIGLHGEDLEEDRMIGPREAGLVCDFLCMHGYPMYTGWARGPSDPMVLPFLGIVTRWMSGKEVLFEEFGAPTIPSSGLPDTNVPMLTEPEAAAFTATALEGLRKAGMTGAMLWCYADYAESTWPTPPLDLAVHERHFGLWRADGSPKPAVDVVKKLARAATESPGPTPSWIDLTIDEFYQNPRENLQRWYGAFLAETDI
jgi:endo-1,4-beta-mannosidase